MFVQVIQATVSHPESVRQQLERWLADLAPGAAGWVGSTSGVTGDGRVIALACFEDAESARANSERAEQGAWWAGMEALFTGPASFAESEDVTATFDGDSYLSAGFVQVMRGTVSDVDAMRNLGPSSGSADLDVWKAFRPEILGQLVAVHPEGAYTVAIYFTSEEAAREGEKKQPPPELQAEMERMNELQAGDIEFFDLHWPWIFAPGARAGG